MTTPSTPSHGAGELLPCPFCGSFAECFQNGGGWRVVCDECNAEVWEDERDWVVDHWNRRTLAAPSAPLAGEAARTEHVPNCAGWEDCECFSRRISHKDRAALISRAERAGKDGDLLAKFNHEARTELQVVQRKLAAAQGEAGRMREALEKIIKWNASVYASDIASAAIAGEKGGLLSDEIARLTAERDSAMRSWADCADERQRLMAALAGMVHWFGRWPEFIPSNERDDIPERVAAAIAQARAAIAGQNP